MKYLQIPLLVLGSMLTACGGSSNSNSNNSDDKQAARCDLSTTKINRCLIEGIETLDDVAENLSDYNLFKDNQDPTKNPNGNGFPYDLTTALFTDYSTKYRYVYIPEGKKANYSEEEVLEFPVGTILVKTFALPKDTANRGFTKGSKDEVLVETRLLVNTANRGWLAFPYVWNDEQTEAKFTPGGKTFNTSIIHKGQQKDFTYGVPDIATCKQCHQLTDLVDGKEVSNFAPIGPKARLLNRDNEIAGQTINQISYMVENNLISGVPTDLATIETIPSFDDTTDLTGKTEQELEKLAKGYLDINCAHCHRRTGESNSYSMDGKAGYSGLKLEYWRGFAEDKVAHGVCKVPIAYSADGFAFDLVPGDASKSILTHRMELGTAKRMPEVGRDLNHDEGVALVKAWINSMPADNCGQ